MDEKNVTVIDLQEGRKVLVQADTPMGFVAVRGEVSYVGNHHFRVQCTKPLRPGLLEPNQKVKITLVEKEDVLPVTTYFVRVLEKDQRTLILKIPIDNWQQNRRAFFRGDMEVQIFAIKSDGTRLHGRTANLSGGGALIALDGPLVMHEVIQLVLEFGRDESISVKAQVVRVDKKKDSELYGMKFLDLSSRDQNTVCRIVLVEEFENRRAEIRELTQRSGNR